MSLEIKDTAIGLLAGAVLTIAGLFAISEKEVVVTPPVSVPAVVAINCPTDWEPRAGDLDHIASERCIQGAIVVHLFPHTGLANYGVNTAAGADSTARLECKDIPNWPQDRCPDEED